ncbi:MAG TPA: hypothetical protein VMD59_14305 [Acidimicrobiales bacterium]|nr:hypothetical protein [Acidimicrobiales bacterium]
MSVRTGFDDPAHPQGDPDDWRGDPEPLGEWLAQGIPRDEAEIWRSWRFRLRAATAWRRAGVVGGLEAAQWTSAGADPGTVRAWRDAGIEATEAVRWHELGFSAKEAAEHRANGLSAEQAYGHRPHGLGAAVAGRLASIQPFVAQSVSFSGLGGNAARLRSFLVAGVALDIAQTYLARDWVDDSAISWAKEGIDASDASLWRELAVRPAEAGRLVRTGTSICDTVCDWWRAGIPIEEVAEWIGAGLSAEEAAAQRAKGITAEQAATLRALRDDPER